MNRAFTARGGSLHLECRSSKIISFTSKLFNIHTNFDLYLKWRQVKIHPRLSFPDLGKKCVVWNLRYLNRLNKFSWSFHFNTTSKNLHITNSWSLVTSSAQSGLSASCVFSLYITREVVAKMAHLSSPTIHHQRVKGRGTVVGPFHAMSFLHKPLITCHSVNQLSFHYY